MSEATYRYHVFLSHNGADKGWTRRLAQDLRDNGLSVFFDEDSIRLGEDLLSAIERGLRASRHVVLVLSPEALASRWVALEYSASLYRDPAASERTLIPVLRRECEVPLILARLKYLDARGDDLKRQVEHLLNGIDRVQIENVDAGGEVPESRVDQNAGTTRTTSAGRHSELLSLFTPLRPGSRSLYIERDADIAARRAVERGDLLVVYGPRRFGKTSLLIRAHAIATSIGKKVAFVDFELFGGGTTTPQVYYGMCRKLADMLGLAAPDASRFLQSPAQALSRYLANLPDNSAIFLDELDMLVGIGALEDFAMILRGVYTERFVHSMKPAVAILISSLRSPARFIQNKFASPFNLGDHVRLSEFERRQSESLIRAVFPSLPTADADELHNLVGGHPCLLQAALSWLCKDHSFQDLIQQATSNDGPFGMFLQYLPHSLSPKQKQALSRGNFGILDSETLDHLEAIGAVRQGQAGPQWLGRLYKMALLGGGSNKKVV